MASYAVCCSAPGRGVLRTDAVTADEAHQAVAEVKRRLLGGRTFHEAKVFEQGAFRFNVSAGARRMTTVDRDGVY